MAENLPINFAIPAEGAVASYNWIDLANGMGYVDLYFLVLANSYLLTNSTNISSNTNYFYSTISFTCIDQDFTTTINTSRTIRGNAYFEIPVTDINGSGTVTVIVTVYKNLTSIGTRTTTKVMTSEGYHSNLISDSVSLTTTNFGVGDILKVHLRVSWAEGASSQFYMGIDPHNGQLYSLTDGHALSMESQSKISIPFKIDL